MAWQYIAVLIASIVLSSILAPRPPSPAPASIGDFDLPTAEVGRPIAVIGGTYTVTGANVVWFGDYEYVAIRSRGGK